MLKVNYTYSFLELSGKPKRFIESLHDCTIKGYGVDKDTVTLCILYETTEAFNLHTKSLQDRFGIVPRDIHFI